MDRVERVAMASTTVRINLSAHRILRELFAQTDESMRTILVRAREENWRKRLLENANAAFAALCANPAA